MCELYAGCHIYRDDQHVVSEAGLSGQRSLQGCGRAVVSVRKSIKSLLHQRIGVTHAKDVSSRRIVDGRFHLLRVGKGPIGLCQPEQCKYFLLHTNPDHATVHPTSLVIPPVPAKFVRRSTSIQTVLHSVRSTDRSKASLFPCFCKRIVQT